MITLETFQKISFCIVMALAIIVVIVTWIGCMAIIKGVWTPVKHWFSYMVKKREPMSQDNPEFNASASLPSSSSARGWNYDVFLSFRGPDTRKGIAFELYDHLQNRSIKTFMDDPSLKKGDDISPTLLRAIEESRFAIVILSEKYAHSTWCLEELTKICQCMENNRILPVFYKVDPTDVRYQKRSFEEAFTNHQNSGRHKSEKVQLWKDALKKVSNISGWDSRNYKTERELVESIVESVYSKVQPIKINNGDFEEFEATRQAINKVMKALRNDEVTAIGVYGMGGVGKTTMVKHVAAEVQKNGIFQNVIMSVISQSPDLIKIQGTLADLLGIKFEVATEIGRAATLRKDIMSKNKILIILDDIWVRVDLSTIGIPSYKELQKCNSKVLLTTRIRNVCHVMKCQEKIHLDILSKQDSWTLFLRNAGKSFESPNFEDVARRVARECCGLPIALVAVARALGDKDLVEWESAVKRLEKSQTSNLDDEGDVFQCIKLSYSYLKDEDSKSCFLLCCLFPEDYDIQIEDLFRYMMGKELFRDADTIQEARETAYSMVKYLQNCSLLLEGTYEGDVRMHDVVRDTAIKIALSEDGHGFLVKARSGLMHWSSPLREGYSAISLMQNKICKLPEELVCPKLKILFLQENHSLHEIPETFFLSLNELRVLNLSRTSISSLPQSFSLLTNLQALYLDFCRKLFDVSILGKLKKLEILSMREYPLEELSREIGHLTNLRMLDVSGKSRLGIVTIPSKVISKLHRLEELYMRFCGFEEWGSRFVGEAEERSRVLGEGEETNIGFDKLTGLSNLKIVQVCIANAYYIPKNVEVKPNWVYFNIQIGRIPYPMSTTRFDHNSRFLHLVGTTISSLPDWFVNVVTTKTEELKYDRCRELINILTEYDHGRLHGLKSLAVLNIHENLKELMNTTRRVQEGPVFENLEKLHLSCLDWLKELCVGELPPGSLINLKLLHVQRCHDLGNVSKFLQRLPKLEELYLFKMYKTEYLVGSEEFEPKQSKLRVMSFGKLNALRSLCNGPAPRAMFQTLKSLAIYRCKIVQSVFTFDVAQCLFQLEDLFVEECPLMERIIEASQETMNNKMTVLPKLKNLVLVELPMLYASSTVDIECPLLEHLFCYKCPHLPISFSGSMNPVQLNDDRVRNDLRNRLWRYKFEF